MKNELINITTEYLPELKQQDLKNFYKVSKQLLPELGLAANCNEKGLYKCVFPEGVTGVLAKAKDGSGNIGTIINEKGIAGQARFVEQAVDPTMMFAAAALHGIEEKLDELIGITKDLFEFEQVKEESSLISDVQFLTQTLRDYQSNVGNQLWMNSKMTVVTQCEKNAFKYIDEYKKLAETAAKDSGLMDKIIHTDDKANNKIEKAIRYFANYQKAVFLFAFSEYVHILVTESFDEKYLENIQKDIERLSNEYRDVFSKVSLQLESYSKGSLDLKAIEMAGDAAQALGKLAKKIPLIEKTDTGKHLENAGDSLKAHSVNNIDAKIKKVCKYQKAPVYQFAENIKEINDMHHKQIEMYVDDNNIYLSNVFN